jgi:arginine deiminase
LTPSNVESLLFDDVLWAKRACEEHDAFAQALRDKGVKVHLFGDLFSDVLSMTEGRAYVLDTLITDDKIGPSLVKPIRQLLEDLEPKELAEYLIGGILKTDLHPMTVKSLAWDQLCANDFVLTPLPNTLFQRDNSCWIYGGVTINPMAKLARQRESLHTRAVYRYHPFFKDEKFEVYLDEEFVHHGATIEGGDVHVLGHGTIMVGMGERTTAAAVEILARRLFETGQARRVIAIELPHSHAFMHLDTVMTMLDTSTFILFPYFDRHLRSWTIVPGDEPGSIDLSKNEDLWETMAQVLEVDHVTVLSIDVDEHAAEREQWDDGTNFLTVSPGVVFGYERNIETNTMLEKNGIEVVAVSGNELGRGRGGPRCMTCPIERESAE